MLEHPFEMTAGRYFVTIFDAEPLAYAAVDRRFLLVPYFGGSRVVSRRP
jgi:hypothetical protein